ncbi:MAG: HD domain-containing protein [Xanthomonadales bacterium]|nr:HD domain-containing protein [Xanthomonadales bacterium]NIX12508.1 HD domain-containing protein [Xanthomonadales bacterium]
MQRTCLAYLEQNLDSDPAHDLSHVKRVVSNTQLLTGIEQADERVTLPAAWLHDCISVPKDSPQRSRASRLAADEAVRVLGEAGYPDDLLPEVHHAIESHSFSAGLTPRTLEAKIVQDADRLEALGAIGIARCLLTGGTLGTPLYDGDDPFCERREPDDRRYTLDHFYVKLFKLPDTMQTEAGRAEARRRVDYMQDFLAELAGEISNSRLSPRS